MCPWAHTYACTLTHMYSVHHASCSYILSTLEQLRVQRSPGVSLVLCMSLMRRNILSTPSLSPFLWWEEVPGHTEASSDLATMKSKVKGRGCDSVKGTLSSPTRSPGFHHQHTEFRRQLWWCTPITLALRGGGGDGNMRNSRSPSSA